MEATTSEFKVTYYVGVMLAQGGILKIMDDHLLFVPRNIEKAMGATDVEIPYDQIKMVEVTGTITEFLMVRTAPKAHKFVGGDLQKVCDRITEALNHHKPSHSAGDRSSDSVPKESRQELEKRIQAQSEKTGSISSCPSCFKVLKTDYNFCPACGTGIRKVCTACRHGMESNWKHCAFCGTAVS